jgi:PBP4 family serine-type D-alanyl-D-alanine carboxypeptidase
MQEAVEELIREREYDMRGLGIVVKDLERDSILVAINPDSMMNPASVQKLVTAAAAIELLGLHHVIPTRIYIDDSNYNPDTGIVRGNMYIMGRGDPGLTGEKIWRLVQNLRHNGIRRVTGDLIIDNTFFDDVGVGPGFSERESRAYQSLISALMPSFSSIGIHHRPGAVPGSPVHIDIFPKIDGIVIENTATTVGGARGRIDIATELRRGVTHVVVKGTMGIEEQPTYTHRRLWQTWQAFGGAFRAVSAESGLRIDGRTVRRAVPDSLINAGPFYTYGTEPVSEFVNLMLKWSSNYVSEMLFKTMGARRRGEPGTWPKGVTAVADWWESRELPGTPYIINGSGMGSVQTRRNQSADSASGQSATTRVRTENLMTASQTVALLSHVHRQKNYYPEFLAALPSAGVDGTLRSRFPRSRLRGIVRAKTGTLNSLRVSALAGYILLDNKTYAFAIFCNDTGSGQFDNWTFQEQVVELVAQEGW